MVRRLRTTDFQKLPEKRAARTVDACRNRYGPKLDIHSPKNVFEHNFKLTHSPSSRETAVTGVFHFS
jgi:hypothetical protein